MTKIKKITVDRELCIGAATCVAAAPEVFELDPENIAIIKKNHNTPDEQILLAAQSCPTSAIILEDENGNQIYP